MAWKYFSKKDSMRKIKDISENLSPEIIIQLYKLGVFLMGKNRFDKELYFIDPEKRALLPIGNFKYPKSLIRFCKKNPFEITVNKSFKESNTVVMKKGENLVTLGNLYKELNL